MLNIRFTWLSMFFYIVSLFITSHVLAQYGPYDISPLNGRYAFSYSQTPDNLVPVNPSITGTSYSWEKSLTPLFDAPVPVGSSATYSFSGPLAQTTYYRRKITVTGVGTVNSNIVKIEVVSQNWEDINYVREHDVLVSGQTDWKAIDQLPIGQKLQTTTYLDGLGRPVENVSRETATPSQGSQWGDAVQFYQYDSYGRQPQQYLPYTTTTEAGKFKSSPVTSEAQYYSNAGTYNETFAYYSTTFDNSPLNRVKNVKSPGTSWAAGLGNSADYDLNSAADNVQEFKIGYTTGSLPVLVGAWPANTLMKTTHTDENGKQVIEYANSLGQVILLKTQVDNSPANAYTGWICTYSVYDDFGLLRFQMQPEAVKWLAAHSWSFAGTDGQKVADELCFRYEYDEKGRNIIKKAPGAKALNMIYDSRDRIVFMQDGNQAVKSTPEWTANLYDALDRLTVTTLYRTTKTRAQLQTDIDNSVTVSTITLNNPAQPVINLVLDKPETGVITHEAQQTIELNPGFEFQSSANDNLTLQINATTALPINVTTVTYNDPITQTDLNNTSICTPVKYLFYDDYSFTAVKSFDNSFDNTTPYPNGGDVMPIATSKRTIGFPTGSLVRVLGTNTFLATTVYYDEKGRQIQSIEDNIKSGKDITTLQYQWDGRLLSSHTKHTTAGSGYSSFGILTKNIFDKIGRVTSIQKKYGSNAFKTIVTYDLDDMGRLKNKHLDPDYPGGGLESLAYTYNIQNNITGINKDYALKTSGSYNKWGHYFGMYLGYDNRDAVFSVGKLDGHVTGLLWNTQGDDNQRKYDYTYDDAGRLSKADFKEKKLPGDAWSNAKLDFSVSGAGANNTVSYDLDGNLLSMIQKGVLPGGTAPATVDNLTYTYASLSNKLTKVADNGTLGANNGALGDFKDGANGADDYVYDDNGNLIIDLNKNATGVSGGVTTPIGTSGIIYNYLDKPEVIKITGKGTINIVYDADGNKLQRTFTPASGTAKVTTYINEFMYQGDVLQYINFEEGRIRVVTPVSTNNGYDGLAIDGNMDLPNGKRGAYDYFIRDYQQNVRMILTEETHYGINQATMESARAVNEEPYFGQEGANNEVAQTRSDKPPGWTSNSSNKVSQLGALTHKAGPNVLLKVMAGDEITATTNYYYQNPVVNSTGNNLTGPIITSLVQSILGGPATSLIKGNTTPISTNLNADALFNSATAPDANNATGNLPKAYLTIVFFNERFEYVSEGSTALRVMQTGNGAAPLVIPNVKAPKNGYAYVYLSNESNEPVYFDDFKVTDTRGRIIEENHYYAFGLKIAGISSVKFGDPNEGMLANRNLYNDKEFFDDADLGWYDYGFRNYDPQIGRFPQLDPLTWDYPELTNYQYASNDPILNIDLDGLEGVPTPGGLWNGSFLEQGVKAASSSLFRPIITNGLSIGSNLANNAVQSNVAQKVINGNNTRYADKVIEEALKKEKYFNFAKPFGLFATLMLTPIETGKELSPKEWYEKIKYTNRPNPIEELKNNGPVLYRFDTRSPFEIAEAGGFKAWGLNFNIMDHVSGKSINNKTSGYVSTSRAREGALDLWKGRKNGYLYRIKFQLTGIDVSTISKFPHQAEVAVPLIIFPSDILGAEKLSKLK